MQNYEKGENIVILPCSNLHHFHSSCIRSWFGINSVCPLCRNNLNDLWNNYYKNQKQIMVIKSKKNKKIY